MSKNNHNLLPFAYFVGAIPCFIGLATIFKGDDKIACYNAQKGIHYTGGLCGLGQDLGGIFGSHYQHIGVAILLIISSLAIISFVNWIGRETK